MVKESKKCPGCKKKLSLASFSPSKKDKDGKILTYASLCKQCRSEYETKRRKQKVLSEGAVHQGTPEKKVKKAVHQSTPVNIFNEADMASIHELINLLPDIKRLLNINTDDSILQGCTVAKTFKVYHSVLDRLSQYMMVRPGERLQDVVSIALSEYMNKH